MRFFNLISVVALTLLAVCSAHPTDGSDCFGCAPSKRIKDPFKTGSLERLRDRFLFYPTKGSDSWYRSVNVDAFHWISIDETIDSSDNWWRPENIETKRKPSSRQALIYDPDQLNATDYTMIFFGANNMDLKLSVETWSFDNSIYDPAHRYTDRFRRIYVEYPGYGFLSAWESPSETKFLAVARGVTAYLIRELGLRPDKMVLVGFSLGTGLATDIAYGLTAYGESKGIQGSSPAALALLAPFTSIRDAIKDYVPIVPNILPDSFNNYKKIDQIFSPVLFIHGEEDKVVSARQSRNLCLQSRSPVKKRIVLPNIGHSIIGGILSDFMASQIQAFLSPLLESSTFANRRLEDCGQ
jgi:fermentation-respiration switch protein FrsA (DUF1100 family)